MGRLFVLGLTRGNPPWIFSHRIGWELDESHGKPRSATGYYSWSPMENSMGTFSVEFATENSTIFHGHATPWSIPAILWNSMEVHAVHWQSL